MTNRQIKVQDSKAGRIRPKDMNDQVIELKAEEYKDYFVNFNSLIDEIRQSNTKSQEDLAFFEKLIHRMITLYWEEHNQYKGKLFQNKLQNKFRNQNSSENRSSSYLKIVYYKTSVEEIIKDILNNFRISSSSQQQLPSLSSNEGNLGTLQPTELHSFQNNHNRRGSTTGGLSPHLPQLHASHNSNLLSDKTPLDISGNSSTQFKQEHLSHLLLINVGAPSPSDSQQQKHALASPNITHSRRVYTSPGSGYTNDSMSAEEFSIVNTLNNMKHTPSSSTESDVKFFSCEECSMVFKRGIDLSRHNSIHQPLLPHICNNCGKSFARKDALKRHYMTATCKRNKINQTYIANLEHLPKENPNEQSALPSRKKKKSESS